MAQTIKDLSGDVLLECSFHIPLRSDAKLPDSSEREVKAWQWLENKLLSVFKGVKVYRDSLYGVQRDPDSGKIVAGELRRYTVPVEKQRLGELRNLLISACDVFNQKSIYLSIAGMVEFVELPG